jgi:hypothetical protein
MIKKVLKTITLTVDSISILVFHTILFTSFFSESVRLNISDLVSTLLSNGVIGLYATLTITNIMFPNFKLWYFIFQEKNLNMFVYNKTMTSSNIEKKLSTWIYLYLPILLFFYIILRP